MYRSKSDFDKADNEHLDRWLISYADYMTLMFALFVVLYSMAIIKEDKYQVLSETLGKVFETKASDGTGIKGEGLLHDNEIVDTTQNLYGTSLVEEKGPELIDGRNEVSTITNKKLGHPLQGLAEKLDNALKDLVENGIAKVQRDNEWLLIELDSGVMFASGSATPTTSAKVVLKQIIDTIGPVNNFIRVRGYTDNQPINTELYSSNWELSVARATESVKILESLDINPARMAIEGYGEYSPFSDNSSDAGRRENRKVVVALSKYAYELPKKNDSIVEIPVTEVKKTTLSKDYDEVQVIELPSGGIRITTRKDNSDIKQPSKIDNK